MGGHPCKGIPRWDMLPGLCRQLQKQGDAIFALGFLQAVLKKYRWSLTSRWLSTNRMSLPEPEATSCQLLWLCIPKSLAQYESSPSAETFATLYDDFGQRIGGHTSGIMGQYYTKCWLDVMVCSGVMPDGHLSSGGPQLAQGIRSI